MNHLFGVKATVHNTCTQIINEQLKYVLLIDLLNYYMYVLGRFLEMCSSH